MEWIISTIILLIIIWIGYCFYDIHEHNEWYEDMKFSCYDLKSKFIYVTFIIVCTIVLISLLIGAVWLIKFCIFGE